MKTRIQETCFPIWCLWSFWYINVAFFLAIFAWGRRILPYWRQYRSITCVFSYIYAYFVVQGEGKGIRRTSALCEKLFWLIYWPLQWSSWGADMSCYLCCGGLHVWCRAGQTFESSSIISLTDYPQLLSLNPPHSTCAYHPVFLHNLIIMIFWGVKFCVFLQDKGAWNRGRILYRSVSISSSLQLRLSKNCTASWALQALAGRLPASPLFFLCCSTFPMPWRVCFEFVLF